jgi:hypothetical protein
MSLIFNTSNFIQQPDPNEKKIKQYVFYYHPLVQKININNPKKIVVHCWGGGGGGGGAEANAAKRGPNSGSGGGGSFTILDFPFYPEKDQLSIEVQIGKGGSGGYFKQTNYIQSENGGDTVVKFIDIKGRIYKEFVSYGGAGGQGNGILNDILKKGGNGGTNTKYNGVLMNANYVADSELTFPKGGRGDQNYGDHCQMNYLSVSGSGGGANFSIYDNNDGGSFILNAGGKGGQTGDFRYNVKAKTAGGGGSTYYGKGGDGGFYLINSSNQFVLGDNAGKSGDKNSGSGGGGSIAFLPSTSTQSIRVSGGDGANGMAVIEVYY